MKISDVIKKLEEIKRLNGDLDCMVIDELYLNDLESDSDSAIKDISLGIGYLIDGSIPIDKVAAIQMGEDVDKLKQVLLFNNNYEEPYNW